MSKGRKTALCIIGLLIIIVSGLLIYIYLSKDLPKGAESNGDKENNSSNKDNKPTTPVEDKIVINNDATDYEMIIEDIDNNDIKATITKCDCSNVHDESDAENAPCDTYNLDKKGVKDIVSKMASTENYEEVATSKACANYNVTVKDENDNLIITAFEGDDHKYLLAGIKDNGYAFDFGEEDITEFLSKLVKGEKIDNIVTADETSN